jgi:hypothetical protein
VFRRGAIWSPTWGWPDETGTATDGQVIVAVGDGDGAWVAPLPGSPAPVVQPSPAPAVEPSASSS